MSIKTSSSAHQKLFMFFCYLLIFSLYYSQFLLSVSIIALVVLSVFRFGGRHDIRIYFNKLFINSLSRLIKHPPFLAVACLFLVVVLSGINSANSMEWLDQLRLKAPFLVIPIVFLNHPFISDKKLNQVYIFFITVATISAILVLINYVLDYETITYNIGSGKPIPTPTHHTRYSIMIAFAIALCIILSTSRTSQPYPKLKIPIVIIGLFLFIFIHILSIRSGLLALYICIAMLSIVLCIRYKRHLYLLVIAITLMVLPIVAYHTIPSFYNKVHYSLYDLQMNKAGQGENYSDSERIISIKTGLQIVKENPLIGIGIGDLEDEVKKIYSDQWIDNQIKLPHNQFVYSAAAMGMIGLVVFTIAFFFPLFYKKNYGDLALLSLIIVIATLCLVEKPLERASFIAFYSFFVSIAISNYYKRKAMLR